MSQCSTSVHSASTIHAEVNGLQQLEQNNRCGRFKVTVVDALVIRSSKIGVVGYSRPCMGCILRMMHSRIEIMDIHYSDGNGSYLVERLTNMYSSPLTRRSYGDRRRLNLNKSREIRKSKSKR